jgi:hypothetical protein
MLPVFRLPNRSSTVSRYTDNPVCDSVEFYEAPFYKSIKITNKIKKTIDAQLKMTA